jgi:hypothetical protein
MDATTLLREIAEVFPSVSKPEGLALSFHKDGCPHCEYLRQELAEYTGPLLPPKAFRILYSEMSCLSPEGWRWVLPSYLPFCLRQDPTLDPVETEFLIYNFSPSAEDESTARTELSLLTPQQVQCLLHFLHWCEAHEHWSEYCAEDITRGLAFLGSLLQNEA